MTRPYVQKNRVTRTLLERVSEKVLMGPNCCWIYSGSRNNRGYGLIGDKPRRKTLLAHRVMFESVNGPIPDGMFICHRCDNRRCVNPEHLWLGTNTDNMRDAAAKGRIRNQNTGRTHCERGHQYTELNTRAKTGRGRACRACEHERYLEANPHRKHRTA